MFWKNSRFKSFVSPRITPSRSISFHACKAVCRQKETVANSGAQSPLKVPTWSCQGFSIIEILVAISILSLLLVIAATTLSELAPKFELDNTVRSVAMALNQARNQAITRGRLVNVTFGSHSYAITDATDGDAVLAMDELSTLAVVAAEDSVSFTPLGMSTAEVFITVSNASHSRTVKVGITGEVMLQ